MKPKYFQVLLGRRTLPPNGERLSGGGLKNFSFGVFNYKTEFFKKISKNIVATIKVTVKNVNIFALRDEKTIINKKNEESGNFEVF